MNLIHTLMDKERSAIMNGKKKAIIIIVAVIAVAFVGLVISSYFWSDTYPIWTELSVPIRDDTGKRISTATIPLPNNSRHVKELMEMNYFVTDESVEEVQKFFDDYVSNLIRVRNEKSQPSNNAFSYYDSQQQLVIVEYEVWEDPETHQCRYWISYDQYSEEWKEIN